MDIGVLLRKIRRRSDEHSLEVNDVREVERERSSDDWLIFLSVPCGVVILACSCTFWGAIIGLIDFNKTWHSFQSLLETLLANDQLIKGILLLTFILVVIAVLLIGASSAYERLSAYKRLRASRIRSQFLESYHVFRNRIEEDT